MYHRLVSLFRFGCAAVVLVLSFGCGSEDGGSNAARSGPTSGNKLPNFVSIGSAPLGGTFYQIGAGIADVLNDGREAGGWRQATNESTGGSLENFRRLDAGDIQVGMANSSITYFAVRGEGGFDRRYDLRTIMTAFPLVAMFVSKQDSGVNTIPDLKGKRVCVGPEGAGFEYFVRPILEAHGVTYNDFDPEYAGMQTSVGYLQDESVAATFLGGGLRSPAITSATTTMDIRLIPYGEKERSDLIATYPSFSAVTVPANTYKGQSEPFAGLNVGSAHLLVRADANDEFVYRVTKTIYEAREKLAETHAAARAIKANTVVKQVGTEFHSGAIRYYNEIEIWAK